MLNFLRSKRLVWTTYFRLFTDGGMPKFTYIPRIRRHYYSSYWGMYGFYIYFLGREFNFSFGKDKNYLYGVHVKDTYEQV